MARKQILYKANDHMGSTVRKGDIIGVDVVAQDKDTKVALVMSPAMDKYECPCLFLVKPVKNEDYYVDAGGDNAYVNLENKNLAGLFMEIIAS